jgi:N-acetylglutamate synthase-like GNAT family acetyltransferase
MEELQIETYTNQYCTAVQDLILAIQKDEFQIDIDLERQPDLSDIPSFYQTQLGNFWIAKFDEKVIGTIALLDIGNRQTALRKMFVEKIFRGKPFQIGQQLLETLILYARAVKVEEIYLGTTEKFVGAQRFYEKNGFAEIDKHDLPNSFPRMTVDVKFYKLKL